jgi:hypothetical protein
MFTTSTNCICHRRAGQGRSPAPIKQLSNVELTPRSSNSSLLVNFNDSDVDTRDPFPKLGQLSTLPKIITGLEYSPAEFDSLSITPYISPWPVDMIDEVLPYRELFDCIFTIYMP